MKTKQLLLSTVLTLSVATLFSQVNVFQSAYGGTGDDYSNSVFQGPDSSYVLSGWSTSFGAGSYDAYVSKVDETGVQEWTLNCGSAAGDWFRSGAPTSDGGYIFLGTYGCNLSTVGDLFLVKTDANGVVAWNKKIGGSAWDDGWRAIETSDGGYILCGFTYSYAAGQFDAYVVKTTSTGTIDWTRSVGGAAGENARSVVETSDGGFAIAGSTLSFGAGGADAFVLKLDDVGAVSWLKTYGGTGDDWGYELQETSDGGLIVAGYTASFGAGSDDAYVIKTDAAGVTEWAKTFGSTGNDKAFSVLENSEGDFVVSGYSTGFGGGQNILTFKMDPTGSITWAKTYGGGALEGADEIYGTMDVAEAIGGYVTAAYTESYGAGGQDFYLIKTDESGYSSCADQTETMTVATAAHTVASQFPSSTTGGTSSSASATIGNETDEEVIECSGVGIEESQFQMAVSIYPNPASGVLFVDLSEVTGNEIEFSIANSLGKIVYRSETAGGVAHEVDVRILAEGMYVVCVTSEGKPIFRERFVR